MSNYVADFTVDFEKDLKNLKLNLKQSTIVTMDEEEILKEGKRTIEIVPVWKYLLQG